MIKIIHILSLFIALGGCSTSGDSPENSSNAAPSDETQSTDPADAADATDGADPVDPSSEASSDELDDSDPVLGNTIVPGESIGLIALGSTYAELRETFGEIPQAFGFRRLYIVPYPELNLEVVYASGSDTGLSDDAWVMALGTDAQDVFEGPVRPGMTRTEVEEAYGIAPEEARGHAFYPSGVSVRYEDDVVLKVGVFEPFTIRLSPPPMEHAENLGVQP